MPPYVLKLIKNHDDKANAIASGLAIRPLTSAEILSHLEDFGTPHTHACTCTHMRTHTHSHLPVISIN